MNARCKPEIPWALASSFARASLQSAWESWRGKEVGALDVQQALYHRAWCNQAARRGENSAAMEIVEIRREKVGKK